VGLGRAHCDMISLAFALSLVTYNIDCYACNDWNARKPAVIEAILGHDVIALQEVSVGTAQETDLTAELPQYDKCPGVTSTWNSITSITYYKKTLGAECLGDIGVIYSCPAIKIGSQRIINCHLPWQKEQSRLALIQLATELREGDVLLGDMNAGFTENTVTWDILSSFFSEYTINRVDVIAIVGNSNKTLYNVRSQNLQGNDTHNLLFAKLRVKNAYIIPIINLILE